MFSANSSQVSDDKLFVEDVFSTYLYTGTGAAQTITNGIDLAGKGGLVWIKSRSAATSNFLFDTTRGVNVEINSNTTDANVTLANSVTAFNSNGFAISSAAGIGVNAATYASWTFREAPKFFDVVTYTGNGSYPRTLSHNLGVAPGMIIIKRTDNDSGWITYHRSLGSQYFLYLDTTAAQGGPFDMWPNVTATTFQIGTDNGVNTNGATYVAYLYAHDATSDGVIQCGSYTGNGLTGQDINIGWEPQWIMVKNATTAGAGWFIVDAMRGMPVINDGAATLRANVSNAEVTYANINPTATGFRLRSGSGDFAFNGSGDTMLYIAIRRPMKTPTLGTSVFSPVTTTINTSSYLVTTNFPVDLTIATNRNSSEQRTFTDRLRGSKTTAARYLDSAATSAEATVSTIGIGLDRNDGVLDNSFMVTSGYSRQPMYWNFRRAPGFFDEVCYTGTGVARTVNHNLGVVPELMIVKRRNTAGFPWVVYSAPTGAFDFMQLNTTDGKITADVWQNTSPTSSVFTVGTGTALNGSGATYVAYLFASCPGVSKVGSYTGNGSSQTINCGFAAGARFVMIKRTDSTGDWYVWDTARGIVAANDPHLSLNTTAAEVTTDDTIDTDSSGFVVNQVAATNVNVNAATYIYLAIA